MTDHRWPRPHWSGLSDENLRRAAAEYSASGDTDLLAIVADIDDDLDRRAQARQARDS